MRAGAAAVALGLTSVIPQISLSYAVELSGPAVIVDGDTMRIGSEDIRIHGIDAPETAQKRQLPKGTWDCARATSDALAAMTDGKTVTCQGNERDQYGRLIARCSTDGEADIGAKRPTTSSSRCGPRRQKVGIWQSKTQPPWECRARRWETAQKVSPSSEGCPIKGNINDKGEKIYHAPWSKSYAKTRIDTTKGERWFCTEAEAIAAGWCAPYR